MINDRIYKLKFGDSEANRIFFTADTHFSHEAIIRYSHRPFTSVEEHDETLIRNWNSVVPKNGIVFHLGDVGFAKNSDLNRILDRLNGKKYLIIGNHDIKTVVKQNANMFHMMEMQLCLQIGSQQMVLNHCPLLCFAGAYKGGWQLFGHVHSGPVSKDGLDIPRLDYLMPSQYDVGVDNNNYTPISYYNLKEIITNQINCSK